MTSIPRFTLPRLPVLGAASLCLAILIGWGLSVVSPTYDHIGPAGVVGALICTAISFWALGQYDVIWHRMTGAQTQPLAAHRSGMAAIAVGQVTGASAFSSALMRRLALPGLNHLQIAQISAGVALSFSACWSLLALLAITFAGHASAIAAPTPILSLGLTSMVGIALLRLVRQKVIRLPDAARLMGWTMLDLTAAAAALYILLPGGHEIAFATFLAVFVLASGAGMLSHLPGGIGVFEAVMIACLPGQDVAAVIGAIVVFRLTYYALPFIVATLWLTASHRAPKPVTTLSAPPPLSPAVWGLAAQTGKLLSTRHGAFHVAQAPFVTVSMGDPLGADPFGLQSIARQSGTLPTFYKCSARLAMQLRKAGWQVLPIASEAVIAPQGWTTTGGAKSSLRRKLRHAQDAGVTVTHCTTALPLQQMQEIARNWANRHGGELGFSMGTYAPDYVAGQEVFLIHRHSKLCGFVTFHRGPQDWALDLMRHDSGLPDGAMHLAIVTAIAAARADGALRFNLAAVPVQTGFVGRLCKGRGGLAQFKRSFGPSWQPLYMAAPSRASLIIAGFSVTWAIQQPLKRLAVRLSAFWELSFLSQNANRQARVASDIDDAMPTGSSPRSCHDEPLVSTA